MLPLCGHLIVRFFCQARQMSSYLVRISGRAARASTLRVYDFEVSTGDPFAKLEDAKDTPGPRASRCLLGGVVMGSTIHAYSLAGGRSRDITPQGNVLECSEDFGPPTLLDVLMAEGDMTRTGSLCHQCRQRLSREGIRTFLVHAYEGWLRDMPDSASKVALAFSLRGPLHTALPLEESEQQN
ncbi:hypothetical protein C8Q70DRAFT_933820 [Cubamyces menziesii]|nr:hypothetical protein C8Q70DRAFT_933820 [Cubamyces menziesii]